MARRSIEELIHLYYEGWATQNRSQVRDLLEDELLFTSPQDRFESAESFLSTCWKYSTGLAGVRFVAEIFEEDEAFVILRWLNEDGTSFADAEYVRVAGGRISEILVVNNDPSFAKLLR